MFHLITGFTDTAEVKYLVNVQGIHFYMPEAKIGSSSIPFVFTFCFSLLACEEF